MHAWLPIAVPRWGIMWGLALSLYAFLKALTWTSRRPTNAPAWKHIAYLLAWPGMDVDAFLNEQPTAEPSTGEWLFATGKMVLGIVLLLVLCPAIARLRQTVVGWTGLLGIVFALHFGLFHLLSCVWRSLQIEARPIMNWPVRAQSLSDFWGQRWNLAFRDLTSAFIFRRLVRPLGAAPALLAGFVGSGLVHDLVISIPAGGGYGLPTLYFTVQGCAALAQRGRRNSWLNSGVGGWLVTAVVLVVPLPLLFHKWFVYGVAVPFIQAVSIV